MLCHVLSFSGYLIPCGNLVAPLVLWLVAKDPTRPFLDAHGREVVNQGGPQPATQVAILGRGPSFCFCF